MVVVVEVWRGPEEVEAVAAEEVEDAVPVPVAVPAVEEGDRRRREEGGAVVEGRACELDLHMVMRMAVRSKIQQRWGSR